MSQPCSRLAFVMAAAWGGLATAQPEQPVRPVDTVAPVEEPEPKSLAVWVGRVESDNLGRTQASEEGSYDTVGLLLGLGHTSTRVEASINADLESRAYSLDVLDDETVGTLNAAAEIQLVQERFSWMFSDNYGQGITDPFSGIGPGNREKINVIASGPRVALPLGGRTSLEVRGTFNERRFEEATNVDSDSVLAEVGAYRQASPTARFGLVASSNDIEYADAIAPKYQIDRVGLRYEKELATGRVLADLGTNEITVGGVDSDEPLFNLVWTRSLTARSDLSIRATREFTDSGGILGSALAPGLEGASFTDVVVSPNPLEQERFGVSYVLTLSRTVVSAELASWQDEYIGNAQYDNDSTTRRVSFVRTVSPRLSFGIDHEQVERDFGAGAGAQPAGEDSWTNAWLNRALGRRFSLGFSVSSYEREGIQPYDERRYELRFGYSPSDSSAAAMESVGR